MMVMIPLLLLLLLPGMCAVVPLPESKQPRSVDRAFLEWVELNNGCPSTSTARSCGALDRRVAITTDSHGFRSIHASAPIPRGTVVVNIMRELVLSEKTARAARPFNTYVTPAFESKYLDPHDDDCPLLILFLAFERTVRLKESEWGPYLAMLPKTFELPSYWEWDQTGDGAAALAAAMDGSAPTLARRIAPVLERSRAAAASLWESKGVMAFVDAVARDHVAGSATDAAAFRKRMQHALVWARHIVATRAWGAEPASWAAERRFAPGICNLVPLIDLTNHHSNSSCKWLQHGTDVSVVSNGTVTQRLVWNGSGLLTVRDLQVGDELTFPYLKQTHGAEVDGEPIGVDNPHPRCRGEELVKLGFISNDAHVLDCVLLTVDLVAEVSRATTRSSTVMGGGGEAAHLASLREAKLALLRKRVVTLEMRWAATSVFDFRDVCPTLLSHLRVCHITSEDELARARAAITSGSSVPVLSTVNELAALRALHRLLASTRAAYRYSMEQDAARVAAGIAQGKQLVNELAVVRVRLGEQQVVAQAQEKLREMWLALLLSND